MKTLIITWIITFSLYSISSIAWAEGNAPADHMHVWTGFTEGSVCISIEDGYDGSDARAELWLVSLDEVEWIEDVVGYGCVDVMAEGETELHAITYDPGVKITVRKDTTARTVLTRL